MTEGVLPILCYQNAMNIYPKSYFHQKTLERSVKLKHIVCFCYVPMILNLFVTNALFTKNYPLSINSMGYKNPLSQARILRRHHNLSSLCTI